MKVAVDLHVHERRGSGDSRTPAWAMADVMFDRYGFAALGFVGHDLIVEADVADAIAIDGIEIEPIAGRYLHILEYVDHDFRVLAHPALTFGGDVKAKAREAIAEYDCDAVERWNWAHGGLQYEGHIDGVIEVAGSDAHSPLGVGLNHMVVDVDTVSADAIMREVQAGRFEVVIERHTTRRFLHQLEKATALAVKRLRPTTENREPWASRVPVD